MSNRRAIDEAKKGSAEILILAVVEDEGHHGYEIAKLIEQRSDGDLRFTLASLYSTLYRMEDRAGRLRNPQPRTCGHSQLGACARRFQCDPRSYRPARRR